MNKLILSSCLIASLTLTGCATGEHTYISGKCITCWNDPLTKAPINHNGTTDLTKAEPQTVGNQTSTSEINNKKQADDNNPKEYKISFNAPINVDIAYLKLKKEFGYFTEQEIRQEWGSMAGAKMQTFAYAYSATPSVHYKMRANRKHRGIFVIIDTDIEKQSATRSKVTISYWIKKHSVNPSQYGETLKKRAWNAINS